MPHIPIVLAAFAMVACSSCTYNPTPKRRDLLVYGALRQTGCSESKLKITKANYNEYGCSCNGCVGGEVRFIANCGDRTWTCKQSGTGGNYSQLEYDLMTECVEIVAKPRRTEPARTLP